MRIPSPLLALAVLPVFGSACSSSTEPAATGQVALQLATLGAGAVSAPAGAAGAVDELVVSSVQLVARKLRLKPAGESCPEEETVGEGSGCANLWLDPVLLEPPVENGAEVIFTVEVPAGTYRDLMVQIHKPTGSAGDAALLAAHPEFEGLSVKVTGTFNGEPFEYTTSVTSVVTIPLEEAVAVAEEEVLAITLLVDVNGWFEAPGGGLLNPIGATQQVQSWIDQNIRESFRAFQDDDADGEADS